MNDKTPEQLGQDWNRQQRTSDVLQQVAEERERQHKRWGEQNHPDYPQNASPLYSREHVNHVRTSCEEDFANGEGSFSAIFLEEFVEALAETNPVKLRAELVQAAAVAVAWCEAIDRRLQESFTTDDVAATMGQAAQKMLEDPNITEIRISIDPKKMRP